jgi:MOSC domain-containing protein YiiM
MKLLSVNLARLGNLFVTESDEMRRIATGIHKQPITGAVHITRNGLNGDEQADSSRHGGPDKAVYAYPSEHYAFWRMQRLAKLKRDLPLPFGSIGENLTLTGLIENDVWIGDRLHLGSVVVEVTEPRYPCFKFNAKMSLSHAAKLMTQSGFSGFYLRVVQEGSVQAGDAIELTPGPRRISIDQINQQRRTGPQQDLF